MISPLGRDARINVNILNQVRRVYLALPSHIQARVLLTAMEHSQSESEMNPEEQASLVRDLLSSGGVVSIKLAQMLAEEAKVPLYYRRLLGGLRESNEPMHVSLFWHSIPKSVRRHIKELGNCIGTGSVKQVHICRFDDGKEANNQGTLVNESFTLYYLVNKKIKQYELIIYQSFYIFFYVKYI